MLCFIKSYIFFIAYKYFQKNQSEHLPVAYFFPHLKENHFVIFFILLPLTLTCHSWELMELSQLNFSQFTFHISLLRVSWQTQKLHDLFEREKMISHVAYITTCWKTTTTESLGKNKIHNRSHRSMTVKNYCRDFWPSQVLAWLSDPSFDSGVGSYL